MVGRGINIERAIETMNQCRKKIIKLKQEGHDRMQYDGEQRKVPYYYRNIGKINNLIVH